MELRLSAYQSSRAREWYRGTHAAWGTPPSYLWEEGISFARLLADTLGEPFLVYHRQFCRDLEGFPSPVLDSCWVRSDSSPKVRGASVLARVEPFED